ncbi:unnamed protein product [Coffea canephora]|uniref:Pentacotripeptide-repeat region of PRORP domain-containing protein n=1 Tax=Coffea canephora TaxID=49390 RepID=A0A068UAC7_COFCA|nr:unnamed protein product [Coffea canephora]
MPCPLQQKVANQLQVCTFRQLKQIHAIIVTSSLHQNPQIRLKFLRRSTEFGDMDYPSLIFSQMGGFLIKDITLWNAMIRGYAYNGPQRDSISMFDEMPHRGLKPNKFTYPYVLNSCTRLGLFRLGQKVHCQIIKTGFQLVLSAAHALFSFYADTCDSSDMGFPKKEMLNNARRTLYGICGVPVELCNRFISGCVKFGDVKCAREFFDQMSERDVVSWNSMISGYAKAGDVANARGLFMQMPEKNVVSWTTMIKAYAAAGDLQTARKIFEMMPEKNLISWNCMISSYAQNKQFQDALRLFEHMRNQGVAADGFTFVSALSACSHLNALDSGRMVHSCITDWGNAAVIVGTALVEMYANCGDIDKAFTIFFKTGNKDVFCFNVMIKSLAVHGRVEDAVKIFYLMQERGLKPNDFTFTSVLFACSHGGFVEEGQNIFHSMDRQFRVSPKLEHYGCLVDLLCRRGQLEEALVLLKEMPFKPDVAIWGALLGGCKLRGDLKLAESITSRNADKLEPNESGVYVTVSNIHASAGQWLKAFNAREKMEEQNMWKTTGISNLVINGDTDL